MKLFYIIFTLFITIVLTSCENLGIEVTTVKGEWKSDPYKNQYLTLKLSDKGLSYRTIHNDSTIVNRTGTWVLHNDTLNLYHQSFKGDGVRRFCVEQMSMNSLTLRNIDNNDVWVFSRLYSTPQKDYESQFQEVFDLKRGFWWYVMVAFTYICAIFLVAGCAAMLWHIGKFIIIWIRRKIKKF